MIAAHSISIGLWPLLGTIGALVLVVFLYKKRKPILKAFSTIILDFFEPFIVTLVVVSLTTVLGFALYYDSKYLNKDLPQDSEWRMLYSSLSGLDDKKSFCLMSKFLSPETSEKLSPGGFGRIVNRFSGDEAKARVCRELIPFVDFSGGEK